MFTTTTTASRPASRRLKARHPLHRPLRLALLPALLLAAMAPSSAATNVYIGPNNGNWTTITNWNNATPPKSHDQALLGTSAPAGTSTLNVNFDAVYTYDTGLGSVTLNSSALLGRLTVTQSSAASALYTDALTVGDTTSQNSYNQSAGRVVVGGLKVGKSSIKNEYNLSGGEVEAGDVQVGVSGAGSFTQTGGSLLMLGGAFSASGMTLGKNAGSDGLYKMSAGILKGNFIYVGAGGKGQLTQTGGSVTVGSLNVGGSDGAGTVDLSGGSMVAGLLVGRNGTFNLKAGGSLTAGIYVQGGGLFNLQGGSFTAAPGVDLSDTNFFGDPVPGGTLRLLGHNLTASSLSGKGGVLESAGGLAVFTLDSSGNDTFQGLIQDGAGSSLSFVKSGTGTQTLAGVSTHTGATSLWGGVLKAGSNSAFSAASDVIINIGTLDVNQQNLSFKTLTGLGGTLAIGTGTVAVGASASGNTYSGQITGGPTGALSKGGAGALILAGGGSFEGSFNVLAGALRNGGADGIATPATVNLAQAGAALQLDFDQALGGLSGTAGTTVQFNNGSQLTVGAGNASTTYLGGFGGAGRLAKVGTGSLTLGAGPKDLQNGNTNGALAMDVNAGSLVLNKGAGSNAVGGALNINGGSVLLNRGQQIADTSTVTLTGGVLDLNGFNETIGALAGPGGSVQLGGGALTVAPTQASAFAGTLAGLGSFVKAGLAEATLSKVGGFLGSFVANAGRLVLQGPANATGYKANSGGTLRFDGGTVALGAASINAAAGGAAEYAGATVNNGFLRGPGTHTVLAGTPSTFNAITTFNSTALVQDGNATFNNFSNGGKFTNNALATINGGGNTASGVIQVNSTLNTVDFTSSGVITVNAGGALANSGGSLVLGGGSRTTINAGGSIATEKGSTIELNGALLVNNGVMTGWTNVNFGSVAKGSGIFGIVNVTEGGRFSPGNSPGLATVGGLFFGAGGSYQFEVNDANGAPGKGFDFINNLGELIFAASPAPGSRFRFEIDSLTLANAPGLALNFDGSVSRDFTLVHSADGITGFDPLAIDIDTTGFHNPTLGGTFSVVANGQDLVLHFQAAAVPEPAPVGLLLAGMGMMGWRLRRIKAAQA